MLVKSTIPSRRQLTMSANGGGPSRLQSARLGAAVAELGSLAGLSNGTFVVLC
jgi:hypothetical protein